MKFALSTNWNNRRLTSGEEIADEAIALGFDALELGFRTTIEQVEGFKRRIDLIPIESVHAFCPVPVSAPRASPELYTLATRDNDARALARFHLRKNIHFAHDIGAQTLVHHAGRVSSESFFNRFFKTSFLQESFKEDDKKRYKKILVKAMKIREKNVQKVKDIFYRELENIVKELEENSITLAFENLPYLGGFPNEQEMKEILDRFSGAPLSAWFDTGHHRVRESFGWLKNDEFLSLPFIGMHLNDVEDTYDNHFAPGDGKVDFKALASIARNARHRVVEPSSSVSAEALKKSLQYLREIW